MSDVQKPHNMHQNNETTPNHPSNDHEQMIIFTVGEQEYCIPILRTKEIRGFETVTYLPHCPDYIEGAINIRGSIVPVVNLSTYLSIPPLENNERHVVIIVEDAHTSSVCGLLVDNVLTIEDIYKDKIQPIPIGGSARGLKGLVTIQDRVVRLLHLDTILERLLRSDAITTSTP